MEEESSPPLLLWLLRLVTGNSNNFTLEAAAGYGLPATPSSPYVRRH
jgi:hypothetical protein